MATANELQYIPEPILSRFAVIEVRQPNHSQMKKVLQSIYLKMLREHDWGAKFSGILSERVIDKVIRSELETVKVFDIEEITMKFTKSMKI